MSSDNNPEHISAREFQNFRDDTKSHFRRLHECDERIESKIDSLTSTLQPIIASDKLATEQKKRRWDVKLLVFGSAVGLCFSVATAVILYTLGIGG